MGCLSDLQTQGHEVSRSLKGLFLFLNYDGVSSRSRSKASLTDMGVGSFK